MSDGRGVIKRWMDFSKSQKPTVTIVPEKANLDVAVLIVQIGMPNNFKRFSYISLKIIPKLD